jgi:hypothetical protein
MSAGRALLPKEHGAYGQLAFPLVTVFAVAGPSSAGVLLGMAAVAGFLAHEPAAVVLGFRGPRARRELRSAGVRWLAFCLAACGVAAVTAAVVIHPDVRWSMAVPAIPALFLSGAMVYGRDKSWYGEAAAACAFAGVTVPVALAAGAPTGAALAVAIPFALLFTTTTLAVRVVILRVRGGGDSHAAAGTRRATFAISALAIGLVAAATATRYLEPAVLAASVPGLVTAVLVAARPPSPARLRTLGWSLVAVSTLTALIVIMAA